MYLVLFQRFPKVYALFLQIVNFQRHDVVVFAGLVGTILSYIISSYDLVLRFQTIFEYDSFLEFYAFQNGI